MRLPPSGACALLALAASLILLGGCGNGGGEGTSSPAQTSTRPATAQQAGEVSSQNPSAEEQGGQREPPPDLPPPTPGSKSAAPGVPTSKQGDNSIQTWGLEASDSERAAAALTVQRYLDARAARNWRLVCKLLAAAPRREQEEFGGEDCPKSMASAAIDASNATLRGEAAIAVLSFRIGAHYAFLIYRRPDGFFATALTRASGRWKLVSVTPNPIG